MIAGYYSGRRPMMRIHMALARFGIEGQIDILVDNGDRVMCILGADIDVLNEKISLLQIRMESS